VANYITTEKISLNQTKRIVHPILGIAMLALIIRLIVTVLRRAPKMITGAVTGAD
jgi:hypothetical protein